MVEVREQIVIHATADRVWRTLADFDGIDRWAPNVDHASLTTSQADGIGAARRVQVGRAALLERVVAWRPDEALAYAIDGLPPVVRDVTNRWSLEPADEGATLVTLTSEITPAGPRPPQQLAARVIGRVLGRASRQMLEGCKREVEGGTRA